MATNPEYYEQWKAEHTGDFERIDKEKQEKQQFEDAKQNFFHATHADDDEREQTFQKTFAEQSVFTQKNQFLIDGSKASAPKHHFEDNIDFQTSNAFYQSLTKNATGNQAANPLDSQVLNELDPEVFEVSAKRQNPIWKTGTYKDPSFRAELNKTTKTTDHGFDTEMAEKLHTNKFNKRTTVISEYSNAIHNGRVFKNPRFTSC